MESQSTTPTLWKATGRMLHGSTLPVAYCVLIIRRNERHVNNATYGRVCTWKTNHNEKRGLSDRRSMPLVALHADLYQRRAFSLPKVSSPYAAPLCVSLRPLCVIPPLLTSLADSFEASVVRLELRRK
ncbi:hypothetical protein, unlikely [Trypanosoma congolense IL3000]|uniref:Uncharacterized protein n=1 Tax=Trypanosoma congolense (strain IL3000) TaxID=1068625 RepID=F9WEE3_TRYCI|nr:hypothetical protein, unlikely [Trypanosoma congolense IL3000]